MNLKVLEQKLGKQVQLGLRRRILRIRETRSSKFARARVVLESALFAADLLGMATRYAEDHKWKTLKPMDSSLLGPGRISGGHFWSFKCGRMSSSG